MSARIYTDDEEHALKLPPLPDVPFCGSKEARRRQGVYEAYRVRHRVDYPIVESLDKPAPMLSIAELKKPPA
jgi:hypothetical protein